MKGDADVVAALNNCLTHQLTVINQYFLHSRMCKDWGFHKLGDAIWKRSIAVMKTAQDVTDRILFLEGMPNFQKLNKLAIGETVEEQLNSDKKFGLEAVKLYRDTVHLCLDRKDYTSHSLMEHALEDEEEYMDWIESQQEVIKQAGLKNYISTTSDISEGGAD